MPSFVQFNDPNAKEILYSPCEKVEEISSVEIQELIPRMKEAMNAAGIGLAANQIGKHIQLFMMESHPPKQEDAEAIDLETKTLYEVPYQVFINPKIVNASKEKVSFWHGCLSAEEQPRGKVASYKHIDIEAYDENAKKIEKRICGLAAVIFQHEFRHLLGSIYLDHTKETLSEEELQQKFAEKKLQSYEECDDSVPLLLADYKVGETIEEYAKKNSCISNGAYAKIEKKVILSG